MGDIVEEWVKKNRRLKHHIAIEKTRDGFFVQLKCVRPVNELDPGPISVAFIGDKPHILWSTWLHGANPADPNYFENIEKLMVDWHNRLSDAIGCEKTI